MSQINYTRLVIETTSPMAINSGHREAGFDTQLARDANDLPYIPASAIAGVWGHITQNHFDDDFYQKWFGTTEQSSSITISNAVVHNSRNQPVMSLTPRTELEKDSLLNLLLQARLMHRERVAINDRGVARETGKFDQLLLPAGLRFSLDLHWNTAREKSTLNQTEWQQLLELWLQPEFAFGSSTRNGLGQIKVIASESEMIELNNNPQAGKRWQTLRQNKQLPKGQLDVLNQCTHNLFAQLPIKALDNWRCGLGTERLGRQETQGSVGIISYSEPKVDWKNNRASLGKPKAVLCGSSIKGILAHRVAYHLRRHKGNWAETMEQASHEQWQERPVELKELFGYADSDEHQNSVAGKLRVSDCQIQYTNTVLRTHNSIDRFTGGVRKGALYTEELLYQPEFMLKLSLEKQHVLSPELKQALLDTLEDLKIGLLPIGAGSGRGNSLVMADANKKWQLKPELIKTKDVMQEISV